MGSPKSRGGGSEITYVRKYFPHKQRSFERLSKQAWKINFLPGKGMRVKEHLLVECRGLRNSNNHVAVPFPAFSRASAPSHCPHHLDTATGRKVFQSSWFLRSSSGREWCVSNTAQHTWQATESFRTRTAAPQIIIYTESSEIYQQGHFKYALKCAESTKIGPQVLFYWFCLTFPNTTIPNLIHW